MTADLEIRISTEGAGEGTRLRFELHSPAGRLPYTRHPIPEVVNLGDRPARYRSRLLQAMENLDRGKRPNESPLPPGGVQQELGSLGSELYKELFPRELKQAYWDFRSQVETLHIVSDEPWIPWELIKPYRGEEEDDFLCCRFELTRWLVGETAPATDFGAVELGVAQVAAIEAGEPSEDEASLPQAEAESRLLADLAARHSGVESVVVADAGYEDVDRTLRLGGHGILHFTGHGWFDPKELDLAGFLLNDGRTFVPRDLTRAIEVRLRQDHPLVFFGSCEAAQQDFALTRLGGWVSRLLLDCGCGAFLGPQWSVRDASSFLFAKTFYSTLEEGRTVARAAREARRKVRDEFPDATTWAAYSVYAHPEARLRLGLGPNPLRVPEFRWRPGVSPEAALLQAEYGVVPFHRRGEEMENLLGWCAEDAPVQVRLYTGAAGMGKTRLALELCRRMREESWQVGLLAPDPARSPVDTWRDLAARALPTLIIVDYAESREEILVPLFRELYRVDEGRFRVILLARAALDWWEHLKKEGEGVGDLLAGPATRWFMLTALGESIEQRQDSYLQAAEAFSQHLEKPAPETAPGGLEERFYERVLLLHMRALADVEGAELSDPDDILDYILLRERRYWGRLAKARNLPEALTEGIGRAMAAINLGGGADNEDHAIAVLASLSFFADQQRSVLVQVARLLHDSYPGEKWIEPLLPDLLGEHLTRRELQAGAGELLGLMAKKQPAEDGGQSTNA